MKLYKPNKKDVKYNQCNLHGINLRATYDECPGNYLNCPGTYIVCPGEYKKC